MTLNEESDYDLLEWVELQGDYPEEGRKAIAILYDRYKTPLYKMLKKILSSHGVQAEEVVDLVTDTFYKIQAEGLTCQKQNDATEASFLYWLITIAKNEYYGILKDRLKKEDHFLLSSFSDEDNQTENDINQSISYNEDSLVYANEEVIVEYIQNLAERDREILLSFFDYYQEGKYTPTKIMSELAFRHNTSIDYIRNVRNRLKKRIVTELSGKIKIRK